MNKDEITEMLVGKLGAVRCLGKVVLTPQSKTVENLPLTMIAGAVVSPCGPLVLPENAKYAEMWECEIIIIPKRKYSGKINKSSGITGHAFCGWRIDKILADRYGNPDCWGPEYFESANKEVKE